jgi:hypothetical protein
VPLIAVAARRRQGCAATWRSETRQTGGGGRGTVGG